MPVDPHVETLLDGLTEQGLKSFERIGVEATRAVIATFTGLQRPAPPVARVIDGTYPGPVGAQPLRIYIPESEGVRSPTTSARSSSLRAIAWPRSTSSRQRPTTPSRH